MKKKLALGLAVMMGLSSFTACQSTQPAAPASTEAASEAAAETEAPAAETEAETAEAAGEEKTDKPYIEIPAEVQSWDESKKEVRRDMLTTADNGMVASLNYVASKVGADILEAGGNAVDAAVATGFALGVCEPMMSGIGGGGAMTIYNAETKETVFISFREMSPKNMDADLWIEDENGEVIGNHKMKGGLSVGVPGEVSGLCYALEKYGTMDLKDVIQPAIDLAYTGYTVTPAFVENVSRAYDTMRFNKQLSEIYLDENGLLPEVGDIIKNPYLAHALERIREKGPEGFYKGQIAENIIDAVQRAGGVIVQEDLDNYQCWEEEPVSTTHNGYTVISSPSPSSGGTFIIETLNIMENLEKYPHGSLEWAHQLSEVQKMVFADRGEYMADTRFVDVPIAGLTNKDYAAKLSGKVEMDKAQTFLFDDPWKYNDDHYNTTGYEVADKEGNMVAVTKTLNYWWGSEVYVEDFGFFLNDQMDDFVTGKQSANSVEPGKAPLSSISPTVILDPEGKPFAVLASPGGSAIYPCIGQLIMNMIDYDMSLEEAFLAPRVIDNGFNFSYDKLTPEVVDGLKALGHENMTEGTFPSPSGIRYVDGGLQGIVNEANPDGAAVGF
ncbi:MAG: gamma-glutamyltransferase [Clostridium sp.]|nr:gamma-glutamyltransferase [Clostridium sp.]